MKKLIGLVGLVLLMAACDLKDAKDVLDSFIPDMTATIDGSEWKADLPAAQLNDNKFIITGTAISGKTIILTVVGTSEGTYNILEAKCLAVYKETLETSTDDAYIGATGSVVLTDVSTSQKRLSGTFSFTAARALTDIVEVTQGTFKDIKYTEAQ